MLINYFKYTKKFLGLTLFLFFKMYLPKSSITLLPFHTKLQSFFFIITGPKNTGFLNMKGKICNIHNIEFNYSSRQVR